MRYESTYLKRIVELKRVIRLLLDVHDGKLDSLDFDAQGMEEDLRWQMARKVLEKR